MIRRVVRRARVAALLLACPLACPLAGPLLSQAPALPLQDAAPGPTVRALRAALVQIAGADQELLPSEGMSTLRGADDAVLERRAVARARVAAGLDTLLEAGPGGRAAIRLLAAEWPGADQVRRAEVRAALRAGDARAALASAERLSADTPRDTQLLSWRVGALESLGRPAEALRLRQARFEIAPNDEGAWRPLLAAHEQAGSLPRLRASLGRLRLLFPESRIVRDHEIEVLHRLGRLDEAARLAADTLGAAP